MSSRMSRPWGADGEVEEGVGKRGEGKKGRRKQRVMK